MIVLAPTCAGEREGTCRLTRGPPATAAGSCSGTTGGFDRFRTGGTCLGVPREFQPQAEVNDEGLVRAGYRVGTVALVGSYIIICYVTTTQIKDQVSVCLKQMAT
jgi:hypothetical protein